MTLIVHHLNASRSQRILWLLEELGLDYTIQHYVRDAVTRFAPPELKRIHPLGKAPLLEIDGVVMQESGAIVQHVCERFGEGRFLPPAGSADSLRHVQFLHYAEGSAMTPLLLHIYVGRLGEAGAPLHPRIADEIATHFDYLEAELRPSGHFVGDDWTGADVMLSFPAELAVQIGGKGRWPKLERFVARIHGRPAWQAALEKGGPYQLA